MKALQNVAEWIKDEIDRIGATRKRLRKKVVQQNKRAKKKYDRENILKVGDIYEIIRYNMVRFGEVTCIYCLKRLNDQNWTLEHLLPLSRGGAHTIMNLDIACKTCNHEKGSQTYEEYIS